MPKEKIESWFKKQGSGQDMVPHKLVEELSVSAEGLDLKMANGTTSFEATFKVKDTGLFHNDFILSNSQIFHSPSDRTVCYFNQEFMSAPISDIDLASVRQVAPETFHPLCTVSNLESVQRYGDAAHPITWYFK